MDVIVICNGLGNQMSQYALYLKKKNINNKTYYIYDKRSRKTHNGFELKRIFDTDSYNKYNDLLYIIFRILSIKKYSFISNLLIKFLNICKITLIEEKSNYDFESKILENYNGIRFLYGGWHSERYFDSIKDLISKKYSFNIENNDKYIKELTEKIRETNSVSIHIRRGDYLTQQNMATFGSVCSKEYFDKAIQKIESIVQKPQYFIFSNDFKWVKENINLTDYIIIDQNKGQDSWKDMYLISKCKHNINSNSTFSWWGAWLNKNKNKTIITPHYFINKVETKDIYPPNWIKLSDY